MPIILPGTVVVGDPIWEFDPVSEDAANANLELTGNYGVKSFSAPMPPPDVLYASSVDTEGENPASVRFRNRTITMEIDVFGTGALSDLEYKVAKMIREKGTLKYTTKGGEVIIFDVLTVDAFDAPTDLVWILGDIAQVSLSFTCKPLGRGEEQDLGDNPETTLPWLVFTEASIPGTWPGLGRLVVDDDSANDQLWVVWGIQSRYYSSATTAALGWQAESLTAMGASATNAGPAGASGSSVMRNTVLTTFDQAILSTQATGGGAHMSHIGSFRVFTRVQVPTTNTGTVTVALEWGEGDFRRYTRNTGTSITPAVEGTWQIVDLGLVNLAKVASGTQRWEGRLLAKSTVANDDIDVDWLMLVPVDEGSGEASSILRVSAPTTFTARDEFDQSAGALNGKTLPVGGTWATTGGATDYTVSGSGVLNRASSVNDTPRYAHAGATTPSTIALESEYESTGWTGNSGGVYARYVDGNNYVAAYVSPSITNDALNPVLLVVVGGSAVLNLEQATGPLAPAANTRWVVRLFVSSHGYVEASFRRANATAAAYTLSGFHSSLITGGTLASGRFGIYDRNTGTAVTRTFDNFAAWVPASDAAIFASQSLELRHNAIDREDSGGTVWSTTSRYEGDYLLVPPSGAEGRSARMIVKASRGLPGTTADTGIDDISAKLYVTPRWLAVPET
jgi:hypothetical protein